MKDLTKGHEAKILVMFSLPMLLGNIFQQLYNVVDTIIVGKYVGERALSAVGQAFPIVVVFLSLIMGFSLASNILIAQFLGAKKEDNVNSSHNNIYNFFLWHFNVNLGILFNSLYIANYAGA